MTLRVEDLLDALAARYEVYATKRELAHVGAGESSAEHGAIPDVYMGVVVDDDSVLYFTLDGGEENRAKTGFRALGYALHVPGRRGGDTGLRRALWDAAFGWVNGWPARDIAYFIWTRSLSARRRDRIIAAKPKPEQVDMPRWGSG